MELIDKYIKIRYSNFMGTKKVLFLMTLAVIMAFSCKSETAQGSTGNNSSNKSSGKYEAFDPSKISHAKYAATREEVQKFIEQQNVFIREGNFDEWRKSLSDEYFAEISSRENLKRLSEQPGMKTRKIVLKTPQDYFEYVVIPSRADLHVDEIEFISENRVKAFTMITNKAGEEQRLRLYDLEKIDDSWTIIN
jgi:hypothetical protein